MKITVFAKRRTTKEGKKFYTYLSKLTKKDGTEITASVRFNEGESPKTEFCPMIIEVDKTKCNLSTRKITNEETGEIRTNYTLWVKDWKKSDEEWVDHSMDDFE